MKLSAFIITLNEEESIERCLHSLHSWADEIVVVDANSQDHTCELAAALGARVLRHEWEGFVGQKNFALAQCAHEWVFSIDADEEVSPQLQEEIAALKPHLDERAAQQDIWAYAVPRLVWYQGGWVRHGDWYPDYVTRLFHAPTSRFIGGAVHEGVQHRGAVHYLQAPLHHYSFRDEADYRARMEQYSTLWAQSKFAGGGRAGWLSPYWRAAFRFWRALFLKRGLLDGRRGIRIAALCAYDVFLKYRKLRQMSARERQT